MKDRMSTRPRSHLIHVSKPVTTLPLSLTLVLMATTQEATAAQVTMWPDKSMKPHYLLSKTECTQELEANGQKRIAWTEFTLPECRMLVRESREAQGIIKPKGAPNNLVKEINNAKLGELRSMCQARQIEHPAKATVGELRLMLKSWLIHSGNNETLIDFGKYKGTSFMEVAQHSAGLRPRWATRTRRIGGFDNSPVGPRGWNTILSRSLRHQ